MKLTFKGNFKEEINELGNSLLLQYLKLNDSEDFLEFESLWYEENKTLNMTLDLSNLELSEEVSSITVMYSDLSHNIIGEAFTLTDTEELNLCTKKRDNNMTRDLNHITVYFPKTAVANIETIIINENAAFLESTAGLVGVNTFLAIEGEYEDEDYLTKNSYKTYLRNQISLKNTKPLYIDRKGEKVTNISTYKHYKKVEIEAIDAISQVVSGDKKRYSVSNGGTVTITGTCYYDLYNVNNGVYTLVTANLMSDLSATVLVQVDIETDTIMDTASEACTIDQFEKSITFNSEKDTETNDFAAILNFIPEIDDIELGYEHGKSASIKSNILEFLTYLRWNVEYSSSLLHDDGNIVMLFDYLANSGIWNYDENREERNSTITLYSETRLNVEDDIEIMPYDDPDSEDGRIMKEYFTINAPVERGQDSSDKRWIYDITITTKLENSGDSLWYPLTTTEEGSTYSKLILNTIKILGSTRNATSNVNFYCVQRPYYPLVPITSGNQIFHNIDGAEIRFPDSIGIKEIKDIYITKPVEGYTKWEAEYRDLDADVVIDAVSPDIIDAEYSDTISSSSSITAITRVPYSYEKLNLGYIKFHRRNNQGAADFTNWRDLIYCHPCNSTQLNFTVQAKNIDTTWAILPDPLRRNYPDLKGTPTKYYYENADDSYRLYLFEERETKSFRIQHQGTAFDTSWIIYENKDLWEKYFSLSVVSESDSTTITIVSKARQDNDSSEVWYPRNVSNNPLWVKIARADTKSETFYCILKPQLGELGLYVRNDNNTYDDISEYEFTVDDRITDGGVIKHRKVVYIDSSVISSEFSNWMVLSKDSEVKVQSTDPSANISYNNSGVILSSNTDAWSANPVYTILETSSLPYNSADIKFENLVLCRTSGSTHCASLADLIKDWKNQLCEDSQLILPMSLKNPVNSDSLQVYTLKKNTTDLERIGTESNPTLELDWIGLYRIFIKSENGFRVRLDSTNISDGFYFFDPSTNEIKKDVLTVDEGSFDSVNGREICFAFIGNEDNSFDVLEQTLKTSIYITNFADESTVVIPLHRKYFNRQSITGILSSQVLDTNIKLSQSLDNRIFIQNSDSGEINIKYSSNLETILEFTDYRENTDGLNINISNPYGEHSFRYNQYLSQGNYKRSGRTVTFGSRGYISSSNSLQYHTYSVENEDLGYPISPIGLISITNPGQLYNQNQEKIETTLYRINPCPSISTDYDGTLMEIRLPYKSNKSAIVHVNAENGFYNLYYKVGNDEYTKVDINSNGFGSVTIGDQVIVERLNTNNDDPLLGLGWKITTLSDYTEDEVNNLSFGGLKFETYVPKDNFLKDETGELDTTTYSQEDVNRLVSPTFKTLTLVRLSKKNSNNTIEGGNPETLISRKGETRNNYILNKVDNESEVSTSEYISEWSSYINSITYNSAAQTLSVSYKNRLQRAGLNSSGATLGYVSYSNGKITSGIVLNRMISLSGGNLDSNFSVRVGESKVTSEGISQEPWEYGIMIDGTIYVGTCSTSLDVFSYNGGTAQHYICQVKLAKTSSSNIEIIDNLLELEEYSIQPAVGNQIINNVVLNPSSSAARWSGRTYTITYPENSETYEQNYRYTIKDDYGNLVSILGSVGVKDQFEVGLYSSYDSTNNTVSENDRLSYVLFSAGGRQMSPVYLLTDYGINGESGEVPYLSSSVSSYSNPIRDESGTSLIGGTSSYYGSYSVDERVLITTSPIRVTKDGKEYMLYKITMTSKVSSVTYQSSFNTVASVPHKRDISLHINYYSYATVTAYYGISYLQLKKPAPSFAHQYYDEETGNPGVVYYYEYRDDEDSGELEKYTRSGSYLVSNTRPKSQSGSSYSFNIANKLLVSYSELGSETAKYGDDFNTLGYYSGWMIEVVRKEWIASGNNVSPTISQISSTYTLTAEGACDIDTGMNQEIDIGDGLVYVSYYDKSGFATCYDGNSEVGIIFELPASRFNNKSGQNYELKNSIPITVAYPDTSWDSLTFSVDMILDFTR